jgi:hypothetical protein
LDIFFSLHKWRLVKGPIKHLPNMPTVASHFSFREWLWPFESCIHGITTEIKISFWSKCFTCQRNINHDVKEYEVLKYWMVNNILILAFYSDIVCVGLWERFALHLTWGKCLFPPQSLLIYISVYCPWLKI